jgi:hypothetical protein
MDDAGKTIRAIFEAIADSVESMTDEEILEEVRASGEDPDLQAEHVRRLLLDAVQSHTSELRANEEMRDSIPGILTP